MAGNTQRDHITGNGNQELQFLKFHNLYNQPITGTTGQFYFNTATYTLHTYGTGWNAIPKVSGAMASQQLMVGNVYTLVPITPPSTTSFVKVNSSSVALTSQYIEITDINPSSYTYTITSPGVNTKFVTEKAVVDFVGSGITSASFKGLSDVFVPTYVGQYGAVPMINFDETGLDLVTSELATFLILDDTPSSFIANRLLKSNSTASAIEWANLSFISDILYTPAINISGGTASKYYGTDSNKNLIAMTDPDIFWKRTGVVIEPRTINNRLTVSVTGVGSSIASIYGTSDAGIGVYGASNTGKGVFGLSTVEGVSGNSTIGIGVTGSSVNGIASSFTVTPAISNTSVEIGRYVRNSTSIADVGLGGYISFRNRIIIDATKESGRINNVWTNVTDNNEVSSFELWLCNTGILAKKISYLGNGSIDTLRGQYSYHAQVLGVDTIGDWRTYSNSVAFYTEYCTLGSSTKGGGTWVIKNTIVI